MEENTLPPPDGDNLVIINPTPREQLYRLLRFFLDGRVDAPSFCKLFEDLASREIDPATLSAVEKVEFGRLFQKIQRNGWADSPSSYLGGSQSGPGEYVELQAAALHTWEALHPGSSLETQAG